MRVRFWDTRGSLAKAGPGTLRYGGNTSCVEVRSAAGTLLVLDYGTGSHGLGQTLMASGPCPSTAISSSATRLCPRSLCPATTGRSMARRDSASLYGTR